MDWIINDELGLTVGHVVGWTAASAMVIGGIIPYVPQYRQIKQTQDSEGFSLHVCLALLVANSLRIFFWFNKRYELPLLIQSIVMNITMFLMIHLCVKVKRNNAIMRTRERVFADPKGDDSSGVKIDGVVGVGVGGLGLKSRSATTDNSAGNNMIIMEGNVIPSDSVINKKRDSSVQPVQHQHHQLQVQQHQQSQNHERPKHYLSDFDMRYFWAWTDFQSYLDFMLVFWIIGAAITYWSLNLNWFMETIGFLAVFTEAMLGAPQFVRNFNNKSTHGMSIHMVILWTLGDMFKTAYFIVRDAPIQFWICGTLQVTLDIAILLQVFIYRKSPSPKHVHRGD